MKSDSYENVYFLEYKSDTVTNYCTVQDPTAIQEVFEHPVKYTFFFCLSLSFSPLSPLPLPPSLPISPLSLLISISLPILAYLCLSSSLLFSLNLLSRTLLFPYSFLFFHFHVSFLFFLFHINLIKEL